MRPSALLNEHFSVFFFFELTRLCLCLLFLAVEVMLLKFCWLLLSGHGWVNSLRSVCLSQLLCAMSGVGLNWFYYTTLSVHGLMFGWLCCGCCFCLDSGNDDDGGGWLAMMMRMVLCSATAAAFLLSLLLLLLCSMLLCHYVLLDR